MTYRVITRDDEDKFLEERIAKNDSLVKELTFDQLVEYILSKRIRLNIEFEEGTEVIDDSQIDEIDRILPSIGKIVTKPRSFIRSNEEKVPIETAKRISCKAIGVLSRDSNDWYMRSVVRVKPKRITAEVSEETLDLYENRFVCTLIDRLTRLVSAALYHCNKEIENYRERKLTAAIKEKGYVDLKNAMPTYYKVFASESEADDSSYVRSLKNRRDKLNRMISLLQRFRLSEMYKSLRNKRVKSPIQRTNILMFDHSYNQAFRLWKALDESGIDKIRVLTSEELPPGRLEGDYREYCLLFLFFCLSDMGFYETTGSKYTLNPSSITISNGMSVFRRDMDGAELRLQIADEIIHLELEDISEKTDDSPAVNFKTKPKKIATKTKTFSEINLKTSYMNFEGMGPSEIEDITSNELDSNIGTNRDSDRIFNYSVHSFDLGRYEMELGEDVCRRFYSMGDMFPADATTGQLSNWGNFRTGILNINPSYPKQNSIKLEKLLNYHLVKRILGKEGTEDSLSKCPICGSRLDKADGRGRFCNNCKRRFYHTFCNVCDPHHENRLFWVKYNDEGFMEDRTVQVVLKTDDIPQRLMLIESLMINCTFTAFDTDGKKLKTICPRCGRVLGEKQS